MLSNVAKRSLKRKSKRKRMTLSVEWPNILCTTGKGILLCISSTARDFRMISGAPSAGGNPQSEVSYLRRVCLLADYAPVSHFINFIEVFDHPMIVSDDEDR